MPRTANEVSYSLIVRFGTKDQCSWIRHGETFNTEAEALKAAKEYAARQIKAIVKRTSYLDTVGLPDGWLGS